jgi:hypothetical protein
VRASIGRAAEEWRKKNAPPLTSLQSPICKFLPTSIGSRGMGGDPDGLPLAAGRGGAASVAGTPVSKDGNKLE